MFSGIASAIAAGVAEISAADGKVAYGSRLVNVLRLGHNYTTYYFVFCSLYLVFPARTPSANVTELAGLGISPSVGRHAGTQAGYQLALLASTLTISIVGGLLTGK